MQNRLNTIVMRSYEHGLVKYFENQSQRTIRQANIEMRANTPKPFVATTTATGGLQEILIVCCIYLFGIFFSLVIFFIEYFCQRKKIVIQKSRYWNLKRKRNFMRLKCIHVLITCWLMSLFFNEIQNSLHLFLTISVLVCRESCVKCQVVHMFNAKWRWWWTVLGPDLTLKFGKLQCFCDDFKNFSWE